MKRRPIKSTTKIRRRKKKPLETTNNTSLSSESLSSESTSKTTSANVESGKKKRILKIKPIRKKETDDAIAKTTNHSSIRKSVERKTIKKPKKLVLKRKIKKEKNELQKSSIDRRSRGNAGYGDVRTTSVHTQSNAPSSWQYKFNYYFRRYPEALQDIIQMDEIASFSVTEAGFAQQISELLLRLPNLSENLSIVDATAGVGGNSMSFLCNFNNITSIEIDQNTSEMLQNNLTATKQILNCRGNFRVLNGDFLSLKNETQIFKNKVDIIFFDPPWGGKDYLKKTNLRLKLGHKFMSQICNEVNSFTKYIALKLPVNYNLREFERDIAIFGGRIFHKETISNAKRVKKMIIVVVDYPNIQNQDTEQAAKKSSVEDRVSSNRNFDLSTYPLNYNSRDTCLSQSSKFPFITDPLEFYNLINRDITFSKSVSINKHVKPKELNLIIYRNLNHQSIINTFNYMFYKIRIGIFVLIKDNQLKYFIPFQNMNFRNNWSDKIKFRNQKNWLDEYILNKKQFKQNAGDDLERDIDKWSANNCLIGNWTGNEVGDMGWYELREILHLTCENKIVNDCAFFFNRRDHPVITPNKTEPYFHIFNNLTTPLDSHNYDNYAPILSYSKNDNFADILFPNYADWRNITGKIYPSSCTDMNSGPINLNWETKKLQAVFRGSATGCGTTIEDNQRIKLSFTAKYWNDNGVHNILKESIENKNLGSQPLLDAGLVGKNLRDKKFENKPMNFFRYNNRDFQFSPRIEMNMQSNYRFIIHIDGHVSAYRLGKELSLGSCILKVDSLYNYKLWFSHLLKPWVHYVPIEKDLSNLGNVIIWCLNHDKECKQIAQNALKLYSDIMTKENILDYSRHIINSISDNYII